MKTSILTEAKGILALATPIILASLVQVLMHLTDMLMLGRYDSVQFAAAGLAGAMWYTALLIIIGSLQGVAAIIANQIGEGREDKVANTFQQGVWLAIGVALLTTLVIPLCGRLLLISDVQAQITYHALQYLDIMALTLPAASAYMVMRYFSEGIEFVYPMMVIQIVILPLNFIGNYALIYGNWGFPELGLRGAGWSTVIGFYLSAIALFLVVRYSKRALRYKPFAAFSKPKWAPIKMQLALGAPIAASLFLEHSLFLASFVMMGYIGTIEAAAHNIAMSYTELTFMVPMGIASALTVKVGNARGRKELGLAKLRGWTGIGLAAVFMLFSALVILLFRNQIVTLYTPDNDIILLAAGFLILAAIFQVSDGTQVAAAGALRGMEDTRITMYVCLIAYWLIGLPVSALLGFTFGYEGEGIWSGLIVGLTVASLLMIWRFKWIVWFESKQADFNLNK